MILACCKVGLDSRPAIAAIPCLPWRGCRCSGRLNRPYREASQPPQ